MAMAENTSSGGGGGTGWLRYLPIAAMAIGAAFAIWRYGDYLSFDALAANREALVAWRDQNWLWAALVFGGAYAAIVAFSVPGAVWATISAGFLFGTAWGSVLTVIAATIGACLVFLAASTSLGRALRTRAGPWLSRVEGEFAKGEVSFLLIMRLVPAMPFFIANLIPAFLNARFVNFVWTTLVGIAPATVVFASIGAGLGAELAEGRAPDLGVIFEPHILGPLLGLALLAAVPLLVRRIRGRSIGK